MICQEHILSNANLFVETQEAFIPLIWLIGAAVAAACAAGACYSSSTHKMKGKSLVVLGMQSAGKTLFYDQLKGKKFHGEYHPTGGAEDIEEFTFEINGKKIKFKKGKDISGGEEFIRSYYENLLNESDIAFFLFNVSKYIKDKTYMSETNARIDFIHRHKPKQIVVIGTHLDAFSNNDRSTVLGKVQTLVLQKSYAGLFDSNFFVLDLRDRDIILQIMEKLFYYE